MPSAAHIVLFAAFALGIAALYLDYRVGMRSRRTAKARAVWPAFVEALVSALSSGHTRFDAFEFAIARAPKALNLRNFACALEREPLRNALAALKGDLEFAEADEFCELMLINESLGGAGLAGLLKAHAKRARLSFALEQQVSVRNSATLSVAKLGVASPWVLLGLLLGRDETAQAFAKPEGLGLLLGGLIVCVLAFRLISYLGSWQNRVRIYG